MPYWLPPIRRGTFSVRMHPNAGHLVAPRSRKVYCNGPREDASQSREPALRQVEPDMLAADANTTAGLLPRRSFSAERKLFWLLLPLAALADLAPKGFSPRAFSLREHLFSEAFERVRIDALLAPTLPSIAPLASLMAHELTGATDSGSLASALRMLSPANLTGLPALSIPCGLVSGQPVGLHLMGPELVDASLLGIARAY